MNFNIRFFKKTVFGAVLILVLGVGNTLAQAQYKIHISDIKREVHKNWLWIPKSVDFTVKWRLYRVQGEGFVSVNFREIPSYKIYCSKDSTFATAETKTVNDTNFSVFLGKEIGEKYSFKIKGLDQHNEVVAVTDTAWAIGGKQASDIGQPPDGREKSWLWYANPGRWQLMLLKRGYIYRSCSNFGKVAFWFLTLSFFYGIFRCLGYSTRVLYLGNVFPFNPFSLNSQVVSYDKAYEHRINLKFRFIVDAWRLVMQRICDVTSKAKSAEEAKKTCFKFWSSSGVKAIETIQKIIAFGSSEEAGPSTAEKKEGDLAQIKKDIKRDFKELLSNGYKLEEIITDIKIGDFPSLKWISAGLQNHKSNGYKWLEASAEVDRAIENRATADLESLKRKSYLDLLWNLGAISPLIGLFGTVTGISMAFLELKELTVAPEQLALVKNLAGGIFEALWTTIFGLINGIILMLTYYYYKNKLDWIYSKWEELYVHISEGL